jgi:ankyrin repeat protein
VYNSQPASVRALVALGANVNTIDNNSRNALHIAAVIGSLECIHILLSETDINLNARDLCGKTPFLYALQKGRTLRRVGGNSGVGNEEIARYLAREGAEIPTKSYETDLTTEAVAEKYNIDQTLLESIIKEER